MLLSLPLILTLAICEVSCGRQFSSYDSQQDSQNANVRSGSGDPSVASAFCDCFNGRTGRGAAQCFENAIHGKKPTLGDVKNCLKTPDGSPACKAAYLIHLYQTYLVDLDVVGSGASAELAALYKSHPSLEGVCSDWESNGKTYITSKLKWVFQHAFASKDLAETSELAGLNSAFSAPGWLLEVDRACKKNGEGEFCNVGTLAQRIFKKAAAFKRATDGLDKSSGDYKACFNAFKLNFFLIKRNYPDRIEELNSWTTSDEASILKRQMEKIVENVNNPEADIMVKIMTVLPGTDEVKNCESSPYRLWCHFKVALSQIKQLIILRKGDLSTESTKKSRKKSKVIHTNLDYREFLSESQADVIWSFAASQSLQALDFAENMKRELERTHGARFAELRQYFVKLQSFNYEIAFADIAFIQGEIDSYTAMGKKLTTEIADRVSVLLNKALGVSAVGLIERFAVLLECAIPTAWLTDSDKLSDLKDAIEGVGEQVMDVIHAHTLKTSFGEMQDLLLKIGIDFNSNNVFLQKTYKLLPKAGKELGVEKFEQSKDDFLDNYNDYSPKVFEDNIAKLEAEWENIIEGACGLLNENDVLPASGLNVIVPTYCWEMKTLMQELTEVFNEIYDYQFELMDAMAAYIRAMTAYTAANMISKDFDRIMSGDSRNAEVVRESELVGMASYVTYEVQQQQALLEYCNILTYKNGGKTLKECRGRNLKLDEVLSLEPARCTFTYEYVDIPVKQRKASTGKFGPNFQSGRAHSTSFKVNFGSLDLNAALSGREMTFQVPNARWLVKNKWATEEEANEPIYIAGLSLFMPRTKNGTRHVISEATWASNNQIKMRGTPYRLSPGPRYIYEYMEGKGSEFRCSKRALENPYQHCWKRALSKICPLSRERPLDNKAAIYPSVFSRFVISVTSDSSTFRKFKSAAPMTIKAGVSLCKFGRRSSADDVMRKKRSETDQGCCNEGEYWFPTKEKCVPCQGGRPVFSNSWCLKNN